jgi:hypothetical protein
MTYKFEIYSMQIDVVKYWKFRQLQINSGVHQNF